MVGRPLSKGLIFAAGWYSFLDLLALALRSLHFQATTNLIIRTGTELTPLEAVV
ncbi:MAG: hypothetical protein GX307_00195 [Euryarchaeota archaeon]|nr:hypothetical protein [Euryarchaeota archaeon]